MVCHVHAGDSDASHEHMLDEDWAMYQDGQELHAELEVFEEPPQSSAADENKTDQYVHWLAVDTDEEEVRVDEVHALQSH